MLSNKSVFTVDLEEWFHANYDENTFSSDKEYEIRVVDNTNRLLELLDKTNSKATFFVLGYVAEKFPELIKKIYDNGHEIASHGMSHKLIYNLSEEDFRKELQDSKKMLKNITGEDVFGFRAPSWSITNKSKWAWKILDEEGFKYSSSVFPLQNFLYGMPDSKLDIYNPVYEGKGLSIIEVPMQVTNILGHKIGYGGGAYLRLFPFYMIKKFVEKRESSHNVFYIHPREIDIRQPKLDLKFMQYMIHYYGVRGCYNKLEKILKTFTCTTMKDYLEL